MSLWGGPKYDTGITKGNGVSSPQVATYRTASGGNTQEVKITSGSKLRNVQFAVKIATSNPAGSTSSSATASQRFGLGTTNTCLQWSGYITGIKSEAKNNSNSKYWFDTWFSDSLQRQLSFTFTNAALLTAIGNLNDLYFFWGYNGSPTCGKIQMFANFEIYTINQTLCTTPNTPIFTYPETNSVTYNPQPWISITCINTDQSLYTGTLQICTSDNNTWTPITTTANGTTLSYTGPIPAAFTSTGTKTIRVRCNNAVGNSSEASISVIYNNITAKTSGNQIVTADYNTLRTATANVEKWFTKSSTMTDALSTVANASLVTSTAINDLNTIIHARPPAASVTNVETSNLILANDYNTVVNAIKAT